MLCKSSIWIKILREYRSRISIFPAGDVGNVSSTSKCQIRCRQSDEVFAVPSLSPSFLPVLSIDSRLLLQVYMEVLVGPLSRGSSFEMRWWAGSEPADPDLLFEVETAHSRKADRGKPSLKAQWMAHAPRVCMNSCLAVWVLLIPAHSKTTFCYFVTL